MAKDLLSIVIPSYNEQGNIEHTAEVVSKIMKDNRIPYELVFVNDGSKDETWDILTSLTRTDPNVVAVNFSRNFGKEAAIFAGLRTARGRRSRAYGLRPSAPARGDSGDV